MTDSTKQAALGSNITKVEDLGDGTFRVHREEIVSGADLAMMVGRIRTALEGADQALWNAGQPGKATDASEAQAAPAKSTGRKGASAKASGAKDAPKEAAAKTGAGKTTAGKGQKAPGRSRGTGAAAKTNARTAAGTETGGAGKQKRLAARSTRSDDRIDMPGLFDGGTAAPAASESPPQGTKSASRKDGGAKASSGKAPKAASGKATAAKGAAEGAASAPSKQPRGKAAKKQDPILAEAGLTAGDATPAKGKAGKAKDAPSKAKGSPGKSAKGKAKPATKASAAPVTKARGEGRRSPLPEIPQGAQTNSPAEVKEAVVSILKSAGSPVPRRQIYIQLHGQGIYVPGQDPIENLATMLYKDNEGRFENLKGQGFVLKA